jgi:hypothetical protein
LGLPSAQLPQDRFAQLDLLRSGGASAADRAVPRGNQHDPALHHVPVLPPGRTDATARANCNLLGTKSGEPDGVLVLEKVHLPGMVHDVESLRGPGEGEDTAYRSRGPHDLDVDAIPMGALVCVENHGQSRGVQEGHTAEIEHDSANGYVPELVYGGLHPTDDSAVKVARDADVDKPTTLVTLDTERVR